MIKQELKVGNDYIIKGIKAHNCKDVYRISVIELTNLSVYFLYKDTEAKKRTLLTEFQYNYSIVEDLGNPLEKSLIDFLKQDYTLYPEHVHVQCRNKICFCDGSCYKPKTFK